MTGWSAFLTKESKVDLSPSIVFPVKRGVAAWKERNTSKILSHIVLPYFYC